MANPGSSGARACYCPRYAPRKKSEGERGGRSCSWVSRERPGSERWPVRPTDGRGRPTRKRRWTPRSGPSSRRIWVSSSHAADPKPAPVSPPSGSWPEKRRGERLPRARTRTVYSWIAAPEKRKKMRRRVAAGVPTLLSLAVIDQLRRRVGPGATVVCAAPWGSGRLPPAKARRWSLLLLEKRPLRWWRRRREAARADVRFFLRGSCQSAGSERGRGARLPHTNRARRKNAELETRRTDARRRKKKLPRGAAHAPAALSRPDWPGVTWPVT
ncbi:hypothetical protein IscW_ISCW001085 [Ixodes scapularis]|uniref:Uncharacterized protein n=1 Tax=Ixodes scapularis TaxID=6945 RepID=B7P6X0_IXOSC|nr:hypothetical protein IscW_ISCW001085 [Ixodes scapularis]|eukprot:XP_002409347.1 hypothetical protein IscW_ISCW001085 [Ixodes scapularis]